MTAASLQKRLHRYKMLIRRATSPSALAALLVAVAAVSMARADFFTSMADLQRLLQVEKDIPRVIDDYVNAEMARLDQLKE